MLDRNSIHVKLYEIAGPRHILRKHQKTLAIELGMSQFTLNRIMSEMVKDGRLKIIGRGNHGAKTYFISKPRYSYDGTEYECQEFTVGNAEETTPTELPSSIR